MSHLNLFNECHALSMQSLDRSMRLLWIVCTPCKQAYALSTHRYALIGIFQGISFSIASEEKGVWDGV